MELNGMSLFCPFIKWSANYASEASNIDVLDPLLKVFNKKVNFPLRYFNFGSIILQSIHPDTFGKSVSKIIGEQGAPGITHSFAYFGTALSCFFPHTEDVGLNSVNLLVHGKAKVWIIVPPRDAPKMEQLMARKSGQPCHHFVQKDLPMNPHELAEAGIEMALVSLFPPLKFNIDR